MTRKRLLLVAVPAALVLSIQLVPYRVENPPVRQEPAWADPQTRELARKACFDCHSNEAMVPWYGHVAPVSWWLRHHVDEARHELNFSEWDLPQHEAHEAQEALLEGEMPLWEYTLLHPEARLTPEETDALAAGFGATPGLSELSP